jgi:hypothetical protein
VLSVRSTSAACCCPVSSKSVTDVGSAAWVVILVMSFTARSARSNTLSAWS